MGPMKLKSLVLLCFLLPSTTLSQETGLKSQYGNADNLMKIVTEKMSENDQKKLAFTYNATHVLRRLDDKGRLLKNSSGKPDEITETILIYGHANKMQRQILERNGEKPIDQNSAGFFLDISKTLTIRYDFYFPYDQPINIGGKTYIVVNFRPKSNLTFGPEKEDQVMNRAEGKIFIDSNSLLIWKLEAWLKNEFTIATWFKVFSANFMIEQQNVDDIVIEKIITITSRYRNGWGIFVDPKNLDEVYTFYNYRRMY